MIGALIGDIVGSRFEWDNHRSKEFELFTRKCEPTDDSIMSLAVAKSILECDCDYSKLSQKTIANMQALGRKYRHAGYGGRFRQWIQLDNPQPYNSFGNGSAMRVGPCGFAAKTLEEAKELSAAVTRVTHNHPEGMKGAEAIAVAAFLARSGKSKEEIRAYVEEHYYKVDFTLDQIRDTYEFNETCQGSVPQALEAFYESTDFEDAIRNAISIGGDSDTIAAITGTVAEAYYGVPEALVRAAMHLMDRTQREILCAFEKRFPTKVIYEDKNNNYSDLWNEKEF